MPPLKKWRIGFIGIGSMGLSHLEAFALHAAGRSVVAAFCAPSDQHVPKAHSIAPDARRFEREEDLLASDLDAVVISTPNATHALLAHKALAAGKHLFLEKPAGISQEECAALSDAARKSSQLILVGHELRYSPYFLRIHQLIQSGAIGRPAHVWCREFRGPFQPKSRDWIRDPRQSGGTLVDKNCHHFDLMNWWTGGVPIRVAGFGGSVRSKPLPGRAPVLDDAVVSFEYHNGIRGCLQLCMYAPPSLGDDLEMGILGDEGLLKTDLSRLEIRHWSHGQSDPQVHTVQAPRGAGWGGHLGFAEIHTAFLDALDSGTQPLTSLENCIDGTRLAIAAEQAVQTGTIVEFPLPQRPDSQRDGRVRSMEWS